MRHLECLACARVWDHEPGAKVVRGILKPRETPGVVTVNGREVKRFAADEYVCDGCATRLPVGQEVAAVSAGTAPPEWWREYLVEKPA